MTATAQPVLNLGHLTAAADYSTTGQYLAVIQTNQTAVLASALGQRCLGILQNDPASGGECDVGVAGIQLARYGGTVAVGDDLVCAANGRLIASNAVGAGPTQSGFPIARAIYAGVDGDIHGVWVNAPPGSAPGIKIMTFPIALAGITATGDVLTNYTLGFAGRIIDVDFQVQTVGAGAGAQVDLNLEIGTTNVTGGVVALTLANTTPAGVAVAGTAITAANAFSATDTFSIEAVVGTVFTGGSGVLIVKYV